MKRIVHRGMALTIVVAPPLAVVALIFVGDQVSRACAVPPAPCGLAPPAPGHPVIIASAIARVALALLTAAWVGSVIALSVSAVRRDREASVGWLVQTVRIGVACGVLGFGFGWFVGGRLWTGAEMAVLAGGLVMCALLMIGLIASLRWTGDSPDGSNR